MIQFNGNFHICAYSSNLENGQIAAFVYLYFLKKKTPTSGKVVNFQLFNFCIFAPLIILDEYMQVHYVNLFRFLKEVLQRCPRRRSNTIGAHCAVLGSPTCGGFLPFSPWCARGCCRVSPTSSAASWHSRAEMPSLSPSSVTSRGPAVPVLSRPLHSSPSLYPKARGTGGLPLSSGLRLGLEGIRGKSER